MVDSETGPDKDKPPASQPSSAIEVSLQSYDAAKLPQHEAVESSNEVDDFGLPARRARPTASRRRTTGAATDKDHEEEDVGKTSRTSLSRPCSPSPRNHSRSRSLVEPLGRSRTSSPLAPVSLGHNLPPRIEETTEHNDKIPTKSQIPRHLTENGYKVPLRGISEWSHQVLASNQVQVEDKKDEDEWQDMPAYGKYDVYDDEGHLVARATRDIDDERDVYEGLGGAGKGYTRVQIDDDAKSATSMDENTSYLFKDRGTDVIDEDEDQRDPLAQMQATKDLLTEGQRIAYVGVTRLVIVQLAKDLEEYQGEKGTKKEVTNAIESMQMWSQKMMVRLYAHMEIDSSEQIMIEQLAEHGVQPGDLTPALMQNSRVKNPLADGSLSSHPLLPASNLNGQDQRPSRSPSIVEEGQTSECPSPPAYELHKDDELPEVRNPTMLPLTKNIDIDLRWTVLCDLFLVLIADSIYDSRSRVLLERVGAALEIRWLDICRFEKRVTDALEMQEAAARETWDEAEHMESHRKMALKRKYVMMGLATVGGSLVIGLSAGLLAPVIGAGLAAGFTTIGVAGTSGFLAGAGGTALITTGAVLSGGTVAVRASHRRTGAVKTFEYRPLHNNKRVNLIVTICGWMNGKVDDVRLPFSTVDPIMGDMYSVLWEPDMLQSMGDTIRILATEALTQGLQQVLASTILTALMASLTLPIILTKLSYLIDNPWTVSLDRAEAAGLILADSLIDRNLGVRPITLVGFSLGSRVIFSCLRELAKKGAYGLVQNVYLFGSPVVGKKEEYLRARTVVSGRFVNGYASNDWILGYLFRATSGGISRVAGLAPVEDVPGIENINFTEHVNGHMAYRAAMPHLLREVGWEVESEEFTEIEDPDPDNHEARQRELIREIDEARKDAQAKPEKRRFGFFKRGKLAEKKGWETYDERSKAGPSSSKAPNDTDERRESRVLFDIDAIRAELESEQMEVRQLESTLPPMRLEINGSRTSTDRIPQSPFPSLRETKSFDNVSLPAKENSENTSQINLPNGHSINPFSDGYSGHDEHTDDVAGGEGNVIMSFEKTPTSVSAASPPAALAWRDQSPHSSVTLQRPELRSAATMPISGGGSGLEHNAWLEEDEDFGQEKQVSLSFE